MEMRSPRSRPSSLAGHSRRRARNTLSRMRASSLNAMKWLQACSAYRRTPRTKANAPTHTNSDVSPRGASKPSTDSAAYPPKIVINAAHRWPISPIKMASTMNPAIGRTSPMSRAITTNPLLRFMRFHRPSRNSPNSAGRSTAQHTARFSSRAPHGCRAPPPNRAP